MYIPNAFRVEDFALLHALMKQFSFAVLVSQSPDDAGGAPFASHLPFIVDTERGEFGMLRAHLARANPHWKMLREDREALVIFQGPHAYVSPSWYEKHPSVPTWNYAVVHAYGVPRLLEDDELRTALRDLTTIHEAGFPQPWTMDGLSEDYIAGMARGIVGIEIPITRLEGKFKLSQNQKPQDRAQVIAQLSRSANPLDVATADLMTDLITGA